MSILDFLKGKKKSETKSSKSTKEEPGTEVKSPAVKYKSPVSETVIDIDGNVYTTVKIGNQIWTAENLKVTKYNDGTPIPLVTGEDEWRELFTDAYCWYKNDSNNKNKYGALYNQFAVDTSKLAPKGWHVSTNAEWDELVRYLEANGYAWRALAAITGNHIAKALAAKTDWDLNTDIGAIGNNLSYNNKSGFSALPAGCRNADGAFGRQSYGGGWWCAEDMRFGSRFRSCHLGCHCESLGRSSVHKQYGYSVRLVRD